MTPSPEIPVSAWKRGLHEVLEAPGRPGRPSFDVILEMLPGIVRVFRGVRKALKMGRVPVMNPTAMLNPGPYMGVPLGGLGGGTIGRGWQGDFSRWQMRPGMFVYNTVPADQFSVYIKREGDEDPTLQTLYPGHPESGRLDSWAWDMPGDLATYHALYPRAWTVYEGIAPGITLTCRQVSPVIPNNYQESSTPAGTFVWTVENSGSSTATVGVMFTFQNGCGTDNDHAGGHSNEAFRLDELGGPVKGVLLHHAHRQPKPLEPGQPPEEQEVYEDPLTFAIASQAKDGVAVTYRTRFVTNSSGIDLWGDFAADGHLDDSDDVRLSTEGMSIGAAVCATVEVPPGETREMAFSLVWDMPLARFHEGRAWYRRYTRFYGRRGNAAPRLAADALVNVIDWEMSIQAWQDTILDDMRLPDWFKQALFNETYYLVEGGSIWTDGEEGQPAGEGMGHFAYLEGHEYLMYNTYDVHFYASFALAMLWPELELSLQRDFATALQVSHPEIMQMKLSGHKAARKLPGAIPHDLGGPGEDPWHKVNVYDYQDVSRWKDLNPKFVLQVYRDFVITQDIEFLAEMWEPVTQALEYMRQFDVDDDGMIENGGFPDQTYDTWTVSGPSAYSGGLWLAALGAAASMADLLDMPEAAAVYRSTLRNGQQVYEDLLWTGSYYAYDASSGRHSNSIMADQLAGDWYARACGLPGVVPEANARLALKKVFDFNVMQFADGQMGAVNGMRPDGRVDDAAMQSQEVWTGTTYGVAAAMLQLGLREEAFTTARGVVRQTYEKLGYWFATPEAWTIKGTHRSLGYMRPLSIWAIWWAWLRYDADELG